MKKHTNIPGLLNVFNEVGKEEFPDDQLDSELTELGYSPLALTQSVNEKISQMKSRETSTKMAPPTTKKFDPFLVAAGGKIRNKREKLKKKLKKR